MFEKIYRVAVLVLLAAILAVNTMSWVGEYKQQQVCQKAIEVNQVVLEKMLDTYTASVYDNPQVDNINKQIFTANEFQVLLLNIQAEISLACH